MKLLKLAFLLLPVLLALVVMGSVLAFNSGYFHEPIQRQVRARLGPGAQAHLGPMRLMLRWPPLVRIGPSMIELGASRLQWGHLEAEALKITAPYSVSLNFNQPRVTLKPAPSNEPLPKTSPGQPSGPGGGRGLPLSVKVRVVDGEVTTDYADISKLNLSFEQKILMKTPAAVHLEGVLHSRFFPVELPFQVDTDKLTFSEATVKTSDLKFYVGGLSSVVQGASLLEEGRHRWLIEIVAKDLARLPQPPVAGFPAKKWRGEVHLKAELNKASSAQAWAADAQFLAKSVGAEVDFKQDQASIKGPFQLDAEGHFSLQNNHPSFPRLKASIDMSQAAVAYGGVLDKAAGLPLKASITAGGDPQKLEALNIQDLSFDLGSFSGRVSGVAELKAPFAGAVNFVLKPVNLAGSEKLFPPLRSSPVQGELSFSGSVRGPLSEPLKTKVVVEAFSLKRFSGAVDYEREGLVKIRGPVVADIYGKGEFADGQLKSAEGQGSADFSAAALVAGPLRKEEKSVLRMSFHVRNQGTSMLIDKLDLTSFLGNLGMNGKVDMSAAPALDMALVAQPLSLSEMRIAMPSLREALPKGSVNSRLKVTGRLELAKPWPDWPLQVSGNVDVAIPEYKASSPSSPAASPVPASGGSVPASPSTSFLPEGELTRRARVQIKAQVGRFLKSPLIAENLSAEGVYASGKFTGNVNVGKVFGGSLQMKGLSVPMLQPKPKIQGGIQWSNVVIEDAIAFAKPEYKDFAAGKTAGTADFATVMPEQADFMSQLALRGEVHAAPVVFNSVKIGEMINAQIEKVPQLKLKPMKVTPLKGQAKAQFDLRSGVVEVPSFQGIDVDESEIQMKGKVVLATLDGDFAGTFYWNDPPVKGCVLEGNADAKGRMKVPIALKGPLMKPGFSVLSEVLGKLAGKALECEGKKALEKVKTEGKEKIEKELKKTLQNLLGK